jgi:hypothetical protein
MPLVHMQAIIYMILEYGEIDLARILQKRFKARNGALPDDMEWSFIRMYWGQMLQVRTQAEQPLSNAPRLRGPH